MPGSVQGRVHQPARTRSPNRPVKLELRDLRRSAVAVVETTEVIRLASPHSADLEKTLKKFLVDEKRAKTPAVRRSF
jgi:hypothetical protein